MNEKDTQGYGSSQDPSQQDSWWNGQPQNPDTAGDEWWRNTNPTIPSGSPQSWGTDSASNGSWGNTTQNQNGNGQWSNTAGQSNNTGWNSSQPYPADSGNQNSYYNSGSGPIPNQPYSQAYGYEVKPAGGGLAVACLVLSIIGFCTGILFVGILLDVLAVILGIVSLTSGRPKKGLAIAGIAVAIISVILTILVYYLVGVSSGSIQDSSYGYSYDTVPSQESEQLMKKIVMQDDPLPDGVLLRYTNRNSCEVDLSVTISYYDENDDIIYLGSAYVQGCAANGECAVIASPPYNKNYDVVPYDHYEILTEATEVNLEYYGPNRVDELEYKTSRSTMDTVIVSLTNPTGATFDSIDMVCIFFEDGEVVGASSDYLYDVKKSATGEFYPPTDEEYNEIPYDDYEVIINNTQTYID